MFATYYVTTKDQEEAGMIATTLIKERLIACANIIPAIRSFNHWEGKMRTTEESAMIMKARKADADKIIARVKELHSYDVPCVTVMPIEAGNPEYLQWIEAETSRS